jgi:2-polyprenyl-3-methyl-5-hydroxy-6-metoxy-1,4-benzoquinol methylase
VQKSYTFVERSRCPACRSSDAKALHRQPFLEAPVSTFIAEHYGVNPDVLAGATYELDECQDCTLIYQRWVGDADLLTELYGVWVHDHGLPSEEPIYQLEIAHPLQSRDAHEIMTAAALLDVPLQQLATLDYGMGWALWARISQKLGCQSFGSDIAQSRMNFAEEHGVNAVRNEELGTPRFHFINTEQVMEHLANPADVAEMLAASLLPGGILKVSVPSGDRISELALKLAATRSGSFANELMPVHPLEHVNAFTRRSLESLAHRLGLEIVRPSLLQSFAFVRRTGALSAFRPSKALKELVRPIYQWRNPSNLYVWMRKAS